MSDQYFDQVEAQLAQLTRSGAHVRHPTRHVPQFGVRGAMVSVAAGAISLAVVAAVVLVALRAGLQPASHPVAPSTTPGHVSPALLAGLQILRRPEHRQDRNAVGLALGTVPCAVRPARRNPSNPLPVPPPHPTTVCTHASPGPSALQRRYGLQDPASLPIRRAAIPTTRIQTWLIAGSRGACWNAVGPQPGHVIGERCFSSTALAHRILLGTIPRPKASGFEVGLVSDAAKAVELHHSDGTTSILPLRDGYFYVRYQTGDTIIADTTHGPKIIQKFR